MSWAWVILWSRISR